MRDAGGGDEQLRAAVRQLADEMRGALGDSVGVTVREVDSARWRTTIATVQPSQGRGPHLQVLVDSDELVLSVDGGEFLHFLDARADRATQGVPHHAGYRGLLSPL